jgi:phospholipid/cholesterol/gamma-HCH transport system substrate-binding protein
VSERLAHGQGLLGGLLKDDGDATLGQAAADFRVAMANLRVVTDRLKTGEGTMGALLADPTVYENLVQFLEGARRSFLLRSLIRSTIPPGGADEKGKAAAPAAGREKK